MWVVWSERDKKIFQQKSKELQAVAFEIEEVLFDWAHGNMKFKGVAFGDFVCNWDRVIL